MKIGKLMLIIVFFIIGIQGRAQIIEGYSFNSFRVEKKSTRKKAKINYQSNPIAKIFRTRITEDYKFGKIDFAGHYITIIWGCGTGCISGAMVDVRDGKVYELPLNEETAYYGCYTNNDNDVDDRVTYKPFSRLFITSICSETDTISSKYVKQEKIFFINIWNEQKKKFELIKKIKKNYLKEKKE